MNGLYELTGQYLTLVNLMDDPDSDEESFSMALAAIEDEIEAKAENYAKIIKSIENQIDGIKAERKRLSNRQTSMERNIAWLKSNLQEAMVATGKTRFKTPLFSFNIQKNGGALPVIVDVDVSELPDNLVIIDEKPDLKAITAYIKETGDISFAHFGERGESLRIK